MPPSMQSTIRPLSTRPLRVAPEHIDRATELLPPISLRMVADWRGLTVVARIIPIYTLCVRLQKTRIRPQGRLAEDSGGANFRGQAQSS